MPDVVRRLALDHAADSSGMCRSCTRGGYGTRHTRSPCTLARLATEAAEIRASVRPSPGIDDVEPLGSDRRATFAR